jgi:lipopolysaccharide transport system ATP-binding protein
MKPAISIESLGKKYRVAHGRPRGAYRTLREALIEAASSPLRRLRRAAQAPTAEDFWALQDVSFNVQPGEVVGIIGRNGAGKSTLLKILSRITKPTKGRAVINGRVGSLLEVGTGFHPELTGRENIFLNGSILGMSKREVSRKFDEIVAFAEIERFLEAPVKRYSSGMYVRLAFAVAAHLEPEILIVDEVLAVGDAAFQKKCLGKMSQVGGDGRTVLFVSHDLGNVTRLCDRGLLLDGGRVEFAGDIASAVARYLPYQARGGDGFVDLSGRGDRSGNGAARFNNIELICDGMRSAAVTFGRSLALRMEVDVRRSMEGASLAVIIATPDGVSIHDLWGPSFPPDRRLGGHQVCATIPAVRLYPGPYSVDLWIGDVGGDRVDYIRNAISFDVVQTSESGIERTLSRKNGLVYQESAWAYGSVAAVADGMSVQPCAGPN